MKVKTSAGCGCGGKMQNGGAARQKLMKGGKAGKCGCGGSVKKAQTGGTATIPAAKPNEKAKLANTFAKPAMSNQRATLPSYGIMAGTTERLMRKKKMDQANSRSINPKKKKTKPGFNPGLMQTGGTAAQAGFASSVNKDAKSNVPIGAKQMKAYETGGLLNIRVNRSYVAEEGVTNEGLPKFKATGKYRNGGMIGRLVGELRRVYPGTPGFVVNGVKY